MKKAIIRPNMIISTSICINIKYLKARYQNITPTIPSMWWVTSGIPRLIGRIEVAGWETIGSKDEGVEIDVVAIELIVLEELGSEVLVIDIVDVLVNIVAELDGINDQVLSVLHWQGES